MKKKAPFSFKFASFDRLSNIQLFVSSYTIHVIASSYDENNANEKMILIDAKIIKNGTAKNRHGRKTIVFVSCEKISNYERWPNLFIAGASKGYK